MDFYLFKEVILGDVSSIIFGYSRVYAKYIGNVLENSHCEVIYGIPPTIKDFFSQYFSNKQTIVLIPFDENGDMLNQKFQFFAHDWNNGYYSVGYNTRWVGSRKDYDKCLDEMKYFMELVPTSRLSFVRVSNGSLISVGDNVAWECGYCPLLYVDRNDVKGLIRD